MKPSILFIAFYILIGYYPSNTLCQTPDLIYRAAIGDTILLVSGNVPYKSWCDDFENFAIDNRDRVNFLVKIENIAGGYNYWLYFTPTKIGKFVDTCKVRWSYKSNKNQCNEAPPPGAVYILNCETVPDSQFYYPTNFHRVELTADTAAELLTAYFKIPFKNHSSDNLWIDSIKAVSGDSLSMYRVGIDTVSGNFLPITIEPSTILDSIPMVFSTDNGPGISNSTIAYVFRHSKEKSNIDSLLIIYSSKSLTNNLIVDPSSQIIFYTNNYSRVDTTITLSWTKFVDSVWVIDYPEAPFLLYSPVITGTKMNIGLMCYPPDPLYNNYSLVTFGYRQRYFNKQYIPRINGRIDTDPLISLSWDLPLTIKNKAIYEADYTIPNPFNSRITIGYTLIYPSEVSLKIIDINGKIVESVLTRSLIGQSSIDVDGSKLPIGSYRYILRYGENIITGMIIKSY